MDFLSKALEQETQISNPKQSRAPKKPKTNRFIKQDITWIRKYQDVLLTLQTKYKTVGTEKKKTVIPFEVIDDIMTSVSNPEKQLFLLEQWIEKMKWYAGQGRFSSGPYELPYLENFYDDCLEVVTIKEFELNEYNKKQYRVVFNKKYSNLHLKKKILGSFQEYYCTPTNKKKPKDEIPF